MPSSVRTLAVALAAAAMLAGCAVGAPDRSGPSASATSDAPEAGETPGLPAPQPSPSPRDPLADLAESAATALPAPTPADEPVLGGDVSWPQCPTGMGIPQRRTLGKPMPLPEARYVVVGLTNGPGMYPNPCLADQVAWVRDRGLMISAYAVVSYPEAAALATYRDDGPFDGETRLGALSNAGYQQALFNVASMRATGFETPLVWIDVETVVGFDWIEDRAANAAVVEGTARGYTDAGYRIGVYSTPFLWEQIVGDLTLDAPEWRAAGPTSRAEALARCDEEWSIQGGPAILGQWVEDDRDLNVTCPGIAPRLGEFFHRF